MHTINNNYLEQNDSNFFMNVITKGNKNLQKLELFDAESIIRRLDINYFKNIEILNYNILNYLLDSIFKKDNYYNSYLDSIVELSENNNFIENYIIYIQNLDISRKLKIFSLKILIDNKSKFNIKIFLNYFLEYKYIDQSLKKIIINNLFNEKDLDVVIYYLNHKKINVLVDVVNSNLLSDEIKNYIMENIKNYPYNISDFKEEYWDQLLKYSLVKSDTENIIRYFVHSNKKITEYLQSLINDKNLKFQKQFYNDLNIEMDQIEMFFDEILKNDEILENNFKKIFSNYSIEFKN